MQKSKNEKINQAMAYLLFAFDNSLQAAKAMNTTPSHIINAINCGSFSWHLAMNMERVTDGVIKAEDLILPKDKDDMVAYKNWLRNKNA